MQKVTLHPMKREHETEIKMCHFVTRNGEHETEPETESSKRRVECITL
jgi:hypothetical protein